MCATEPDSVSPQTDEPEPASGSELAASREDTRQFVPAWLAGLVLVLLLAVMGLGGYVIRGVVAGETKAPDISEERIERWKRAVADNPEDLDARVQLGYAYQLAGRYDNAVDAYTHVIERNPRDTAALYNLGIVYGRLGVDRRAEEMLWDVLEVEKDHVLAARALGEIYVERGQYRSLLSAVRPVVEARPEVADLQYLTGLAYENLGQTEWAVARYRLALTYAPGYEKAIEGLDRLGKLIR